MGMSVQFNDKLQVEDAYKSRGVDAWSIWCSKQFMFKGVGFDSLENILNTLCDGSTNATYTLKVYEDIENENEIKSNTPDDGSFNFRLNDEKQNIRKEQLGAFYRNDTILKKLDEIDKRFEALESFEEDPRRPKSAIGELLENPAIAGIVPTIIELLVKAISGAGAGAVAANIPQVQNTISGIPDNERKDLDVVINELKRFDPNVLEHLKKLLDLARNNNQLFNTVVNSL